MAKRNYIFNTIQSVPSFRLSADWNPSMENLSTLMGKYGDEGDKLLFKIQNSGDYFSGITDEELLSRNAVKSGKSLWERTALWSHCTVCPLCGDASWWDKFSFQTLSNSTGMACRPSLKRTLSWVLSVDADVVGSNSLLNEVELVQMIDRVFNKFGVRISVKINNRKILTGIAEIIGEGW